MSLSRPVAAIFSLRSPCTLGLHLSPLATAPAHSGLSSQQRSKHSATQVKRLFKKNPARLRILKKNETLPAAAGGDASASAESAVKIPTRSYPPVFKPKFLQNGWSAPPPAEFEIPKYPFQVKRTGRKPFGVPGFLPVYRDIRIHGTKHTTIIRNVTGDIPAFLNELQAVIELPTPKKGILNTYATGGTGSFRGNSARHGGGEAGRGVSVENPIRIRAGGTIEVNGDWTREVKGWLAGLGF
ncbi:hypothetical protein ACHAWX_006093 [Stephanocyclus meneghinianus]